MSVFSSIFGLVQYSINARQIIWKTKNPKTMALIKYNTQDYRPTTFRSFVDKFFNDEFSGGSVSTFTPKVDIAETETSFEIELQAPGLNKADFNIEINKDYLEVSGERKFDNESKEKNFHSVESYYGSFKRSFYLPDVVDRDNIDAEYKDGILYVSLPKDEKKTVKKLVAVK